MIDAENDESFNSIYEHRRGAKDRSVNANSELLMFPSRGPMNSSSFQDLLVAPGESQLLFSRSGERDRANLEQFQMISVVGRGTFAKVFLVHLPINQKYYALKSMRKDVIIDKKSLENVNLERLIMLQVDHPFIVAMHYVFQRT